MTQTQFPDQPFFANDMWGLLKVLLVVVAPVVAGVLAGIWKILRGPLQEADRQLLEEIRRVDEALRREVGGLDGRMTGAQEQASALAAEVAALKAEQSVSAAEHLALRDATGEMKHTVHHLAAASAETKTDIIAALDEARREHAAALGAATQRQAERDSRMAERVARVETLLEVDGRARREPVRERLRARAAGDMR